MGRIRTIKPEFFTHEDLFEAEEQTGLPLRLAFAGLWTQCDKEGRFKWRPKTLKSAILPFDSIDFSRVLDALMTRGFVVRYASSDEWFGYVPSWRKHQHINNRETHSEIPDPKSKTSVIHEVEDASITREQRVVHATEGEGKGREGKGKEKEKNSEPSGSGAGAPVNPLLLVERPKHPKPPETQTTQADPVKEIFDRGVAALGGTPSCRAILGKARRQFGDVAVLAAIQATETEQPSDPIAWFLACCERKSVNGSHAPSTRASRAEDEAEAILAGHMRAGKRNAEQAEAERIARGKPRLEAVPPPTDDAA